MSGESREPHPFAHLPIALQRRLGVLRHEPSGDAEFLEHLVPAWLRETSAENRLPVTVAVLVAVALQFVLPRRFSLPPRELLPSLELLVLITLVAMNPVRLEVERRGLRALGITLIGAMTLANAFSAGLLADHLVNASPGTRQAHCSSRAAAFTSLTSSRSRCGTGSSTAADHSHADTAKTHTPTSSSRR